METKSYREADNNVVIKSGDFAARFFYNYGGALLEFWKDNFPIITDPFPGSGCVNVIDGQTQDLSQTSPDGITPYSLKNNVYLKDSLNLLTHTYSTSGFLPCFWLSHEAIDDVQPVGPAVWATPYQLPMKWSGGASIAFVPHGNIVNRSIIFPRDTLNYTATFTEAICKFRRSLISAKTKVFLRSADSSSYGGIVFRHDPTGLSDRPSHKEVSDAPHYSFIVTRSGKWSIRKVHTSIKHGNLSYLQRMRLRNNTGLEIEVRTLPDTNSRVQFFIEGKLVYTANLPTNDLETGAGLIAYAQSGKVDFDTRTFIDTSIGCYATYTPRVDKFGISCIDHHVSFESLVPEPYKMYRAGGGTFLNPFTFPPNNRKTAYLDKYDKWVDHDGLLPLRQAKAFYAGTIAGEVGLTVVPLHASIDRESTITNGLAHALISKLQINNSFVIMFNTQGIIINSKIRETQLALRYYNFQNNNPDIPLT